MIEDMKKKAKQKEEGKEVMIEWYGQIIPVESKKKPVLSNENEPPKFPAEKPKSDQPLAEIRPKKSISYEIMNKREEEHTSEAENGIAKNARTEEDAQKVNEEPQQKPREKWNKVCLEPKEPEPLISSGDHQSNDDYIEQMINELQEIVIVL